MTENATPPPPPRAFGLLYGIGFGGFVDGIVLHQILQWHHMVSDVAEYPTTTVAGLEANTLADGLFHVATWVCLLAATVLAISTWQRGRLAPTWRFHLGLMLAGWGLFNLAEGLVNHQILGVHHVRDDLGAPLSWDLGFLASGALLVLVGWLLHRSGARAWATRAVSPETAPAAHRST
ncbi:DUF2243 domain-containing protein [Nocardioides sp. cx-173]|uniref:DUF2243 domain-containing protein n=1 Tax=Nocardioides sp. cx-173 TaxID=2898796 RepID=UPI001E6243C2|nr:DUF2243 domain-containing protein [Nocardioides sp. cx-173]MCD4525576.1 DUF2243 domain-containing protein [Nocardioides sp. cx-173]UGB42720.1 DUF2243 domain-containing protein [Nocardioides sp. cx-173]